MDIYKQRTTYVLISLSILYVTILLFDTVMTNRYIGGVSLYILGGTLTSPIIFLLDDITTEIYGYRTTIFLILFAFFAQTVFSLFSYLVVIMPHPAFGAKSPYIEMNQHVNYYYDSYKLIFGQSLLRMDLSGFIAYAIANIFNTKVISRWKVLVKGRIFWLRSLTSSAIAEILYTSIAIVMMEIRSIPLHGVFKIIAASYIIKMIFNLLSSYPSQILVTLLKKYTNTDVFDLPEKYKIKKS